MFVEGAAPPPPPREAPIWHYILNTTVHFFNFGYFLNDCKTLADRPKICKVDRSVAVCPKCIRLVCIFQGLEYRFS